MELVDEKLDKLELKLLKLEKHVRQVNQFMAYDMRNNYNLCMSAIAMAVGKEFELSHLDDYLEDIKLREKELKNLQHSVICESPSQLLSGVIWMASVSKIPFVELAPYLIRKLGKKTAKRIVERETMLQYYGKGGLSIWDALLKE